jgi:hypothetical protein
MRDSGLPQVDSRTKSFRLALAALAMLVVSLFVISDLALPGLVSISDYTTSFYVSSRLVVENRIADLYPAKTDTALAGTSYDRAAHAYLPALPKSMTAIFPYPPLVAVLLSPLAFLPQNIALLAFQIVCLGALFFAAALLGNRSLFLYSFLFTPIIVTMWIGQLGILLGILVYAAGYHFLRKDRAALAGALWSLTLLKPQFALVPIVVALVWLVKRRWQLLAGLASGAVLIGAVNFIAFGPDVVRSWLGAMKLTEAIYLSPTAGVARHLAVSVPRMILFNVPYEQLASWRYVVYALSLIIFAAAVAAACLFARKSDIASATGAAILTGSLAIPLVAPHLFYYDLCVLSFAGAVFVSTSLPQPMKGRIKNWLIALWILISSYPILFEVSRSMYLPLLLLVPISAAFIHLVLLLCQSPAKTSQAGEDQNDVQQESRDKGQGQPDF